MAKSLNPSDGAHGHGATESPTRSAE